jgi:hypothetical protein
MKKKVINNAHFLAYAVPLIRKSQLCLKRVKVVQIHLNQTTKPMTVELSSVCTKKEKRCIQNQPLMPTSFSIMQSLR